jgi:hypothetical protein
MKKIKVSSLKKIVSETHKKTLIKENIEEQLLKNIEDKIIDFKQKIESIMNDGSFDFKVILTTTKGLNDTIDNISKTIFDEANLLNNISLDKMYSLNNIIAKLNNLSITINLLANKLASKIKNKNSTFKSNELNKNKMEVESKVHEIFLKVDKEKIQPLIKKIYEIEKELSNTYKNISSKL